MSLYRSIATAVGTREALDLAHRLAAWHDAMVMHRRRAGDEAGPSCDVDCPHEQAESLWLEALEVYGERAREFAFLRTFGGVGAHTRLASPNCACDSSPGDPVRYLRAVKGSHENSFRPDNRRIRVGAGHHCGSSESRLLMRALIIGFVPAIWAASHVVERLTGRDMWHFSAPYPYRWMRDRGGTRRRGRTPSGSRSKVVRNRRPCDASIGRLTQH